MTIRLAGILAAATVTIGCGKPSPPREPAASNPPGPSPSAGAHETKDAEKLQGVWRVVSLDNGEKISNDKLKGMRLIVHKDLLHLVEDLKTHQGRSFEYTIDPGHTPGHIDLRQVPKGPDEFTSPSIYKLDGDKLTIAYVMARGGPVPRPTEFKVVRSETSKPPFGVMVMEFAKSNDPIPQTYIDVSVPC